VSIHWGNNWGYEIPHAQKAFAHSLIDGGVDLVHGHSSHHAKGLEVYRKHAILYGCGDFFNDYEGIHGYDAYRSNLALMYFIRLAPPTGDLFELRLVPMQIQHFRLSHASPADVRWIGQVLHQESAAFGTGVGPNSDNSLSVRLS
jgi:poly-gamma-glutamate synthesis protein (capsule biosynthesis protein)